MKLRDKAKREKAYGLLRAFRNYYFQSPFWPGQSPFDTRPARLRRVPKIIYAHVANNTVNLQFCVNAWNFKNHSRKCYAILECEERQRR